MTAKSAKKKETGVKGAIFTCRSCNQSKPFSDMVVMMRFFPPVTVCQDCTRKLDYKEVREPDQETTQEVTQEVA